MEILIVLLTIAAAIGAALYSEKQFLTSISKLESAEDNLLSLTDRMNIVLEVVEGRDEVSLEPIIRTVAPPGFDKILMEWGREVSHQTDLDLIAIQRLISMASLNIDNSSSGLVTSLERGYFETYIAYEKEKFKAPNPLTIKPSVVKYEVFPFHARGVKRRLAYH